MSDEPLPPPPPLFREMFKCFVQRSYPNGLPPSTAMVCEYSYFGGMSALLQMLEESSKHESETVTSAVMFAAEYEVKMVMDKLRAQLKQPPPRSQN